MADNSKINQAFLDSELDEEQWQEWYRLTPEERLNISTQLLEYYLSVGGSLDPEPDPQSPFYFPEEPMPSPADGGAGVRVIRRGPV